VARRHSPRSRIAPYLAGGLGLIRFGVGAMTISVPQGTGTEPASSRTGVLSELGIGVEVSTGTRGGLFAECRYGVGLTAGETTQFVPVRLGVVIR
jgi:hypothetical protein